MFYEKEFIDLNKWVDETEGDILFTSGAFGDFFLGVDCALKNKMSLIYWSKPNTLSFSKKFLSVFDIKNYIIDVGVESWRNKNTHEFCTKIKELLNKRGYRTHCNNKCDLPIVKYFPDLVNQEYFNFKNYKLNLPEKYCLLCPCGNNNNHKIRRFFYNKEFEILTNLILTKNIEPVIVGNDMQLNRYNNKNKFKCLQFNKFDEQEIQIEHFIESVRSSLFVISPDTSLKTLSAAMHVPTFVLKNRNIKDEFVSGPWDRIFLDKNKWKTLECFTFENLLKRILAYNYIKMI